MNTAINLKEKLGAKSAYSILTFVLFVGVTVLARVMPVPTANAAVSFDPLPETTVFNDFVVGPGKIEIELAPGETKTFELTVTNRLGTLKTFSISEEDFTGSNDPKQTVVLLGDDRGPYSLKDYLQLGTTTINIPHATKSHIPVTVSIPLNAQPGGLYGSVVIGTVSKSSDTSNLSGVTTTNPIVTRIGTLVFIRVKGTANENGRLTKFMLSGDKTFVSDTKSVIFDLLYKNDGNVHLNPYGKITVTNLLGSNVGTIDVDPWFAMPNSLRFREVEWKPEFLFGRYTAKAEIARGYGNLTDTLELTFWVIPWKLILLIIVGLLIIMGGIKWIFSKFKIARR